jgi:hypothetical protein
MPDLTKTFVDGIILSILASLFIMLTLLINPRVWLHDYPKDVQAKAPPKTPEEKKLSLWMGIPFMLLLFGGPLVSTINMKFFVGESISFFGLFLHAFGVVWIFNIVDWLILDWVIFCTLTPKFLVIPGTEGMAGYKDYFMHFRGFLIGTIFSAIAGLIVAGIVALS